MNAANHENSGWDDRWIDRLVDGELTPSERTALLQKLDNIPGGWRRCALAFLEAQAWREAMTSSKSQVANAPDSLPQNVASTRSVAVFSLPPNRATWQGWLSIAATLLVALGVGWLGIKNLRGLPTQSPDVAHASDVTSKRARPSPVEVVPNATLVSQSSPVVGQPLDSRWLATVPKPLPESVVRQLRRNGYEVEESEAVISMDLDDGRKVAVTVDEVKFQYVGDHSL